MPVKIPALGTTSPEAIKEVARLAKRQIAIQTDILLLESQLEAKRKDLWRVSTIDIPAAMASAGVKYIGLEDGSKVEVSDFITGNIKEENRIKAHAWLRDNGFGDLIKRAFAISFGMGEFRKAASLAVFLGRRKIPYQDKEAVHAQTLRAFIREQLEAGTALPPQIEVVSVPTTKITPRKDSHHGK